MKKVISLLLVLLFVVTMVAGCGQNKETNKTSDNATTVNEAVNTANSNESKGNDEPQKTTNSTDTSLFGIPQKTDDYAIKDLLDTQNEANAYVLNQNKDLVVGMEGFIIIGEELKEGDYYPQGSGFFFWARPGKAVVIKEITYTDENYHVTLEEVEKGTPQSREMLYIVCRKQFKDVSFKYADGTDSLNISKLNNEVGLEKLSGKFQSVDLDKNTIEIIPSTASIPYTYALVNVSPESLEGLQKGDEIEYMHGNYKFLYDTVYAVVKKADN